ncbi:MAG: phosphotriesterase-related protein [Pseudonocardiales bacterium]|nr:MAG: phosphotriesterase-related protein [Pseudonocardiales bacterium]
MPCSRSHRPYLAGGTSVVQTVRGEISPANLGTVLMHEHVFVLSEEIRINYPEYWDEQARVADAVAKLTALKALGVDTIADPTVIGLGRDIRRIQRVNAEVDINIIAATGLYTYNDLPFFLQYVGPDTLFGGEDPMIAMFVRDLTEGIADTGVKAAFLKCAIDAPGLTPGVERVIRAVAAAHTRTGAPITVHTNPHIQAGLIVQDILRDAGVDLSRVVLGHSGDSTDLEHLTALMAAGSFIGMDRFGLDVLMPFEQRVDTVAELCRRGHAGQMVLAHDASCYIDWFPPQAKQATVPNWNYTHIHDDVLPALRERGVTEEQITTMLIDNPRRFFADAG